jgi:hypothetical protein
METDKTQFAIEDNQKKPQKKSFALLFFSILWLSFTLFMCTMLFGPILMGKEVHFTMNNVPTVASPDNLKPLIGFTIIMMIFLIIGFFLLYAGIKSIKNSNFSPITISNKQNQMSSKMALIIGLLFILSGLFVLLMGLGVIPVKKTQTEVPDLILDFAGLLFVFGGAAVINGKNFNSEIDIQKTSLKVKIIQYLLGVGMLLMFLMILGWVVFVPGERHFGGDLLFLSDKSNEIVGRVIFGIGFFMMLFMLIYGTISIIRDIKNNPPKN